VPELCATDTSADTEPDTRVHVLESHVARRHVLQPQIPPVSIPGKHGDLWDLCTFRHAWNQLQWFRHPWRELL